MSKKKTESMVEVKPLVIETKSEPVVHTNTDNPLTWDVPTSVGNIDWQGDQVVLTFDMKALLQAHGAEFVKARVMNDVIYITGKKPAQ